MDTESIAGCSDVPMTPSRNSNRHELLWENFPNCTHSHWEEIGRTPNVGPRPRNYSKAVNLSDRRRTLSEGQDWFDDLSRTDFDEVFIKDKFIPFKDASSQVSGGRLKEARNSRNHVSQDVSPTEESSSRDRKRPVGPRVLDSGDFSSSSDDVLHGPVFYIGSGETSLISNSPAGLLSKNNRHQLTKDISRAAKQLKYFEQPSRNERGQKTGSLSAATKGSTTREYLNGYTAVDWPVYEGLGTQQNASVVDGSKPGKRIFRISNEALDAEVDRPALSIRNPLELPTSSDEDSRYPNDYFASSSDSYEQSTTKNSCSRETSKLKDTFAWNICFDPTPMKSDGTRFAAEERKESPSTSRQGSASHSETQFQPGTSRKKWDKTSKNSNLGECCEKPVAGITFTNGQSNLVDLYGDNYDNEAENLVRRNYSPISLRSVYDHGNRKQKELKNITDPFSRTLKPCDLKERPNARYSSCWRRTKEYPATGSNHSNSIRSDFTRSRSGNYYYRKGSEYQSGRPNRFNSKKCSRKRESECRVHGKGKSRNKHDQLCANCDLHNATSDSIESSGNEESCRHGGCVDHCCPLAAYLPILLSQGCNHTVLPDLACKRKMCKCCSEAKARGCQRLRKACAVYEETRRTRLHSSEEREPDFDAAYDEVDREANGIDGIDGKTYRVREKSEARKVRRGNSLIFRKTSESPVLVSYRRSVDTATDVLEGEQKSDTSSQTEPTTSNCSTQVKPVVRHSVTQYSAKVNNHNKDTQCMTHTTSVCMQAVVFEPLDHGTQFPERKENHHKQTQCNLATGRKSVQANLKFKPNLFGYSYGTGTSYRHKDDSFPEDFSFRSSHSSYLMPPDLSANLTIVAPKSAPPSAVVAVAAASASADYRPQVDAGKDSSEQPAKNLGVSPVTLRCSVMSVRPVEMFPNEKVMRLNERSGEDCVDEGRQRTVSLRNSSVETSAGPHYSRSRGKSVSFPTDIARFFDHPNSLQRRVSSDDSGSSDDIKMSVHPLQYSGYMN